MFRTALGAFVRANISACNWVESYLPRSFTRSLLYRHELLVAGAMNAHPNQVILDIGGGHECPYAHHRQPELNTTIIAVDILESQLQANRAADWRIVANVCDPLPFQDSSIDILTTRSVMEHLQNNALFVRECSRVLRPGGRCVHVFPSRFAPFAILNRLLPTKFAQKVLYFIFPEWRDECGFLAYYNDCYVPKILSMFEAANLNVKMVECRYYQSIYFKFFIPFYLLLVGYDLAIWLLGARMLSCQVLLMAEKPSAHSQVLEANERAFRAG